MNNTINNDNQDSVKSQNYNKIKEVIDKFIAIANEPKNKNKKIINDLINNKIDKKKNKNNDLIYTRIKYKDLSKQQVIDLIIELKNKTETKYNSLNNKNLAQIEYYKGYNLVLDKFLNLVKITQSLIIKDYIEYLELTKSKAEKEQIVEVGFTNTTGKINLRCTFLLGKINSAKSIMNLLLDKTNN
jgi:hypothetical protein